LIISDIHANLSALEAVIEEVEKVDAYWCLGDLVGYGPDPNECIDIIKDLPNLVCLMGNHDAATSGIIDDITFNPMARQAIRWTNDTITPENLEYLQGLPESAVNGDVTFAHGSPREPVWEYLLDTRNATENFGYFKTEYCLIGHTHLPTMYTLKEGDYQAKLIVPEQGNVVDLEPRAIVNPGSVGQPRDRDPRAAYAVFDTEKLTVEFHRVPYDIQSVQERMRKADLPHRHIQRLADGW